MRQAIITKYIGPTNHRGGRIAVKAQADGKLYPWSHLLSTEENHIAAATKFAKELGWVDSESDLVGGGMPDGTGYAFVVKPK